MIKYAVYPGRIMSRNDGDIHFIGAAALIELYKVPRNECVIRWPTDPVIIETLIPLKPQDDGNYTLEDFNA